MRVVAKLDLLIEPAQTERLDELERSRALWEAEMEAGFLKADSKYKAAAAAEARTRKQLDKLDLFDSEGEEGQEALQPHNAPGGEAEGVFPVHVDVAPDYRPSAKEYALRHKFS